MGLRGVMGAPSRFTMEMNLPETPQNAAYKVEYKAFPSGKGGGYYIDGKRTKRVTSVLKKFPDSGEGLLEWSKKRVALTISRLLNDRVIDGGAGLRWCHFAAAEIAGLVDQAYRNPDEIKDETADVGTAVHGFVEEWLKAGATKKAEAEIRVKYMLPDMPELLEILQRQTETENMTDAERNLFYDKMKSYMFARFCEFWRRSGLTYVGSEIMVGSRKHVYAGRIDILARDRKGRLVLADFKTNKWVAPSMFAQVAAYKLAYEEMTGEKIHRCVIVQCPREWTEHNMGFGVYPVPSIAKYRTIFTFLLKTWEQTEFKAARCRKEKL